jgi:hypothetical protein
MIVELLRAPGCPHADALRREALAALRQLHLPIAIAERVGAHPSPTLLVDGLDVITGRPPPGGACCRLDRPRRGQIVAAIRRVRDSDAARIGRPRGAGP